MDMMIKKWGAIFILMLSINALKAGDHTLGLSVGPSFMQSDLGGGLAIGKPGIVDVDPEAIRFTLSFHYRYFVNDFFAVKANLMFAMLHGDDKYTKGVPPPNDTDNWFRELRNLNFTTYLGEVSVMGEVNLKRYQTTAYGRREMNSWTPYIGLGAGFFYFEPFSTYQGVTYNLRKLGTEGQNITGKKYSPFQLDLLASAGIRYNINGVVSLSAEVIYHHTFTDYLDDVSTSYPSIDVYNQMSPTAQALSKRNLEPGAPYPDPRWDFIIWDQYGGGQQRGDPKDKDHFFNVQFSFAVNIGKRTKDQNCYYRNGGRF
jgi:hypothetical protein